MAGLGKEYVIGKGRLYFEKFKDGTKAGTGEHYFGNTPELSASREAETLDHYDADEGMNVKDETITTSQTTTLSFVTDNVSNENVGMWFGGDVSKLTLAEATDIKETFTVSLGRFIQLGKSDIHPQGTRNVVNVKVSKLGEDTVDSSGAPVPGTPVELSLAGNVDVDLESGRIYIEGDAADILDGDVLEVTYDQEAVERTQMIAKGQELRGSMRFIATNPVGPKKDYYWPYVKLTANGDYALKGDEWQQLGFTVEVMKLDAKTETTYVEMR